MGLDVPQENIDLVPNISRQRGKLDVIKFVSRQQSLQKLADTVFFLSIQRRAELGLIENVATEVIPEAIRVQTKADVQESSDPNERGVWVIKQNLQLLFRATQDEEAIQARKEIRRVRSRTRHEWFHIVAMQIDLIDDLLHCLFFRQIILEKPALQQGIPKRRGEVEGTRVGEFQGHALFLFALLQHIDLSRKPRHLHRLGRIAVVPAMQASVRLGLGVVHAAPRGHIS
mmetsp:Transcript_15401/g.33421  ORF Transcript_15401/g.33421 Transcript_15401/m.33421 type:complete len:229 (+) Transcript_15401:933-1619(+)